VCEEEVSQGQPGQQAEETSTAVASNDSAAEEGIDWHQSASTA